MGDWGNYQGAFKTAIYPTSGYVTTINSGSTRHNKGSWGELIASVPFDARLVIWSGYVAAGIKHLFDIGIGAAGSEQLILENVSIQPKYSSQGLHLFETPILVPAGVRLAARSQADYATAYPLTYCVLLIPILGYSGLPCSRGTAYGANTAASIGTAFTCGNGSKGSWVELSSSLPHDIRAILPFFACQANASYGWLTYTIDIGIGAAGSEQIIAADLPGYKNNGQVLGGCSFSPFPIHIPSGTRLAIRGKADGSDTACNGLVVGFH